VLSQEIFMQRALELARLGAGTVAPNPMVGCVIVHNDSIIGEGWHRQFGAPHAEVNAINSVKDKSLLSKSTLYVTLEPCNHFGKTPPCTGLILEHKIPEVVIASPDPNPLVAGKGIKKLRDAGVKVTTNVLLEEAMELNRRFFVFHQQERAYVILKYAQTTDGFIAKDIAKVSSEEYLLAKQISGAAAQKWVHKWRTEEDAILVGSATVAGDNPRLNARLWSGKNPVRVLIDDSGAMAGNAHVLDGSQATLIFTTLKNYQPVKGAEVIVLAKQRFAAQLLHQLFERKIMSVMVEGGKQTLQTFIDENLWDEARIFTSPKTYLSGIAAPSIKGEIIEKKQVGADWFTLIKNTIN